MKAIEDLNQRIKDLKLVYYIYIYYQFYSQQYINISNINICL